MNSEVEKRREDVQRIMASMQDPLNIGTIIDIEGGLILHAATKSYVDGNDVAAIICAHASSERDLLSYVAHWEYRSDAEPPKRFEYWGLGRLIDFLGDVVPSGLLADLAALNDHRKTLYHYGHANTVSGLHRKADSFVSEVGTATLVESYIAVHGRSPDTKELHTHAIDLMLRTFAQDALSAALQSRDWVIANDHPKKD